MTTLEYGDFAAVYDRLMEDVDYDLWARYLSGLMREKGVLPGDAVLDCACGTGQITLRLGREGYCMTGADRAERMLEIAQQNTRKAGLKIPFVCQDMRAINVHKPVRAVTCACDGVNYLLDHADLDAFFKSANAALKDGGLLLFDVSSEYKLEHVLDGQTYGEDTKECTYLWQNCYDPKTRLLEMRLAFFRPNGKGEYTRFDELHVQRAHTVAELTQALERTGFSVAGVYGAFTNKAPNPKSERIQFVAQKSEK